MEEQKLYEMLITSVLKVDSKTSKKMYLQIKNYSLEILLKALESVFLTLKESNYITNQMITNVHSIYENLLEMYNYDSRITISYNKIKDLLTNIVTDDLYMCIYEDIEKREINNHLLINLFPSLPDKFYAKRLNELMDDISYDYYTIDFLINDKPVDKNISLDKRFLKSLRYICSVYPNIFCIEKYHIKTEKLLQDNIEEIKNNNIDSEVKKLNKKILNYFR